MSSAVLAVFLACYGARCAVEWGLELLNLRHLVRHGHEVPPALASRVPAGAALRGRDYALARGRLALVASVAGAAFSLVLLLSGALPALDQALGRLGLSGAHRFAAFVALLALAGAAAGLPLAAYRTFVLEARFGFNRTTPALWLRDRAVGLLLAAALGLPVLYAAHALFERAGRAWWIWLFAFLAAVQLLLAWLGPALLAPLFHRFRPLPEGSLRSRIEALARRAGFRTRGIYLVDASRRSAHSNAYFTGLWRPRIVLFDTLVQASPEEETVAVLAHEMGHYAGRHVVRGLALGLAAQLAGLAVLARLVEWPPLFQAFGFPGPSLQATVALVALGGEAFTFVLAPLAAWLSRRHEAAADAFAVRVGATPGALQAALLRLAEDNRASLRPHPWYRAWHHSHPTLAERIAALDRPGPDPASAS